MAEREGVLDLRRKAQLAWAKPTDHAPDVVLGRSSTFDLDQTIFKSLDATLPRLMAKDRLSIEINWSNEASSKIEEAFKSVPKAPAYDAPLVEFMINDCNFAMEHADGHFMDHLRFCYEYSANYFKSESPRVMLLHSIMGVGTNYFPMGKEKVPKLRSLLTEVEMKHIEAFPSLLRLVLHGELLDDLESRGADLSKLQKLDFRRVIDNERLSLDAASLWVQLNYQLVHLLDFLPIANWEEADGDTFLEPFKRLYLILKQSGKLMARVDLNVTEPTAALATARPPLSLGGLINRVVPSSLKRNMSRKAIVKFSAAIGHSLGYTLHWDDGSSVSGNPEQAGGFLPCGRRR